MPVKTKPKTLAESVAGAIPANRRRKRAPVWKGPKVDGVTFSLLSRFIVDRERFRALVVEGLRPAPAFNPRIEFGNLWHAAEEAGEDWRAAMVGYASKLCGEYPFDRERIAHWHSLAEAMYPEYLAHWAGHPHARAKRAFAERTFRAPLLAHRREVVLRGKWDAVDVVGGRTWLQENKTKSQIDPGKIIRQLGFDLQTMIYLVALVEDRRKLGLPLIAGVRYNVVRRPAHKSVESAMKKLREDREDRRAGEWFARFEARVTAADIARFRNECLDPILANLSDWWGHIEGGGDPFAPEALQGESPDVCRHWRHPYGVYNVLDEGGSSDLDAYLDTGSEAGLVRTDDLFPELKEG